MLTTVEKLGFEVKIDSQDGKTQIHNKETGVNLEFTLKESVKRSAHEDTPAEQMARQRYAMKARTNVHAQPPNIPFYDYVPTGILTLEVGKWPSKTWKDTPRTPLENRIDELATGIVLVSQRAYEHEQEHKRRRLVEQQAQERREFLSKRREAELARLQKVEAQASNWERATKLRAFAEAYEQQESARGNLSAEQLEWLSWVRAKADGLDPLTPICDPILGAPERPRYGY
ncbi:hypothetical protein [Herbaspirillum camelliae]|uniref:hypothetical protein n=1 Tax=Herbaspirillum camelliae TaxID=1892903 RepID=UPI00117BAB76|nr:hypothetical protein [Herbaspirillum camelliae]